MDRPATTADGLATPPAWTLPVWAWLLGALALCVWHGWLTLSLFGDDPCNTVLNDQPIASGFHPQHLYIGSLGANSMIARGRTVVFDFGFQAGWLKTPIFDGGRLAELALLVGGGSYQPAAYKVGFVIACCLVPIVLLSAGRAAGLGNTATLLATFLALLVWWGPHGRAALVSGDCEVNLAALAGLAHVGFLIAFHRDPSFRSWFGLWVTGCVGWFLQPLLFPIALPILLAYYLSVGTKHDFLTWHFAFWGVELLAIAVNLPWLSDWIDSWWLRTALPSPAGMLEHRTFDTVWNAPLWGGDAGRLLAVFIIASAVVGTIVLNQTQQRPAARLLGMSALGSLVLALLGISWEPIGALGTAALFAPALWFACLPAAHAWTWLLGGLWRRGKAGRLFAAALLAGVVGCFAYFTETPCTLLARCVPGEPLEIGLNADRQAIVDALIAHTDEDARVLWEDRGSGRDRSQWPALLPILTQRRYIGALDPNGVIEHSSMCLSKNMLETQLIETMKDEEWTDYCRRYNVRWIVAWTPALIERLDRWPAAKKVVPLTDGERGWLFEIKRTPNYALRGKAVVESADAHQLMLRNVEPQDGVVVLSVHYQAGMRASPSRVQVERATSGEDQIGFVRLILTRDAPVVTLTWDR